MNKSAYIFAFCLFAVGGARAQLSGSVAVEGEYDPLVIDVERVNIYPELYNSDLMPVNLQYEYSGIVTDFRPSLLPMGVTGWNVADPCAGRRGFVDLRLGSWLNSRLHAGVDILSDSRQKLEAYLKFRSTSLWRMHKDEEAADPARRQLYDGTLGLRYKRLFGSEGLLKADAGYRLGYFNYYGSLVGSPSQTLNMAHAGVSYASSPSFVRGWHAGVGVDYSGFRRLYGPLLEKESVRGDAETHLAVEGGYKFSFAEVSAINIDAEGDFLFYGRNRSEFIAAPADNDRDWGLITLKPSYRFERNGFQIQAGVNLGFTYNAMGRQAGENFPSAHVAPDVKLAYKTRGFGVRVEAGGGVTPLTLAWREKYNLYLLPYELTTLPLYTPVDAQLGVDFGPFAGFAGAVGLRYAAQRNAPLGGFYQYYLNGGFLSEMPGAVNLHGFEVKLNLHYSYGTHFAVNFDGAYVPQSGTRGVFNGFDRPRWVLDASAECRPLSHLKAEVGYNFRGVRNCCYLSGGALRSMRLDDISNLRAKVAYSVLPNLDIYVLGENLLCRRQELLPGLATPGIILSGGLHLTF